MHELRARMRSPQAYAVLTIYMSVVSGITLLVYIAASASGNSGVNDSSRVGSALFYIVVGMQTVLVSFVTPWFTAGAISGERENNTYDLLRLTLITPRQIVTSKLLSAFGYTAMLIFATLPLLSLALLLGGVEVNQVLAALSVILAAAFLFSCLGLFVSSRLRTTVSSTILTYSVVLGIVIGMSVLTLIALPLLNSILYGTSTVVKTSPLLAALIQLFLFVMMSFSPISTLVASEANMQESGSLFSVTVNPIPGTTTPFDIPAPFFITLVLYLSIGAALLILTIRRLAHPSQAD
jgi:ABC-type transport system involved in multi-copper enzyme maturation permease subunit